MQARNLLGLALKIPSIELILDSIGTAFKEITTKSLQNPVKAPAKMVASLEEHRMTH